MADEFDVRIPSYLDPVKNMRVDDYMFSRDTASITLGSGPFSTVLQGIYRYTRDKTAGKRFSFRKQAMQDQELVDTFKAEEAILVLHTPEHRNVLKVYHVGPGGGEEDGLVDINVWTGKEGFDMVYVWQVMDFCTLGDLQAFTKNTDFSIGRKVDMMIQCAQGLLHLHHNNIIHGNIKPENILVTGEADTPEIQLSDYATYGTRILMRERCLEMFPKAKINENYFAPELFSQDPPGRIGEPTEKTDVFSLGLVFLALLESSKKSPMKPLTVKGKIMGKYMQKECADYTPDLSNRKDSDTVKALKRIISSMLMFKSEDRPDIKQVLDDLLEVQASLKVLFTLENSGTRKFFVYDDDAWKKITELTEVGPPGYHTLCTVPGGIFAIGGIKRLESKNPEGYCVFYSFAQDIWFGFPDMKNGRIGCSCAAVGDEVLVVGGRSLQGDLLDACEKLNYKKRSWCSGTSMNEGAFKPLVEAVGSNLIIIACAHIGSERIMIRYNSVSDAYDYQTPFPEEIQTTLGASLANVDDLLYLMGGKEGLSYVYNLPYDQWTELQKPLCTYDGCSVAVRGCKIVVCGGTTSEHEQRDMIEEYDTKTNQWTISKNHLPFQHCALTSFATYLDKV